MVLALLGGAVIAFSAWETTESLKNPEAEEPST